MNFTADDIFRYVDLNGIDYREDSTNAEQKYLRNRLRHSLIPQLLDIEPEFKFKMRPFFSEINEISVFLDDQAEIFNSINFSEVMGEKALNIDIIKNSSPLIVQFALNRFGIRRSNLNTFYKFLDSSPGSVFHTESHVIHKDRDHLIFSKNSIGAQQIFIRIDQFPTSVHTEAGMFQFEIINVENLDRSRSNNPIQVDLEKIEMPVVMRNWQHGDKITPLGMTGTKLVSDILIDNKIPQYFKSKTLIIEEHGGKIIGIPGIMINEFYKADQLTKQLLQITKTPS